MEDDRNVRVNLKKGFQRVTGHKEAALAVKGSPSTYAGVSQGCWSSMSVVSRVEAERGSENLSGGRPPGHERIGCGAKLDIHG